MRCSFERCINFAQNNLNYSD
ncbi:hypothetical protein F383_35395 [Gossypium arboreum]|uniref:Uncharacterized protein n=1 Tax=Gossypium arboreum TaxID=29729 RepID=A0A0B0N8B1_GOSAR|nr:hypothetical protein F383_35395 [Gossypium arboreum]